MACIQGTNQNDTLRGTSNTNCIRGRQGNDFLNGKGGNDTLNGGGGADRFFFRNIQSVEYLGGKTYRVLSNDGADIIQDFNANAGDRILNRKNNKTTVYNIGNAAGNPGGGSTPAGNGTALGSPSFDLAPLQPLIGGATPFSEGGMSIQLGISQGNPLVLTNQKNPQLPFLIKNRLKGFEGNQVGVFEITPTSQYRFESEAVIVSTPEPEELQSVTISNNSSDPNFKQVVIVLKDAEAPGTSLHDGTVNADSLVGSSDDDIMSGFAGNDTLRGAAGDDIILGWAGNDSLVGGIGADSIYGNENNDIIVGNAGEDRLNGGAGRDTIRGGAGNDVMFGWMGNDQLRGDGGHDFLDGESGNDTLNGGAGNDTLQGGIGNDRIIGGANIDLLIEKGIGFTLTNNRLIGLGTDTLIGIENVHLIGLETDDRLDASAFSQGNVTLDGGDGEDSLIGGSGEDSLIGGSGNDSLESGNSNDNLKGGVGDDSLSGGSGRDVLMGSGLGAGTGEIDILNGGSGFDVFVLGNQFKNFYDDNLTTASEGIRDYALIQDFQADIDTIKLKGSETYFLENITLDGVLGAGIYEAKGTVIDFEGNASINRELVGLVAGVNALSLSVNVGTQFSSIGFPLL